METKTQVNWTNSDFNQDEVRQFVRDLMPTLHSDESKYLTTTVKYQNISIIVKLEWPHIKVSVGGSNDVHVITPTDAVDQYASAIDTALRSLRSMKTEYQNLIDKQYLINIEMKLAGKKYTKRKEE